MKKFSDFARENKNLSGKKMDVRQIFGKEIELTGVRFLQSKVPNKICAQMQFNLDGEQYIAFTTSEVVVRQLRDYESEIPFLTTFTRKDKYHTLT